ncbi:MAG: DUF1554 domain-containing protein [Bradymonadaceae bacterium]
MRPHLTVFLLSILLASCISGNLTRGTDTGSTRDSGPRPDTDTTGGVDGADTDPRTDSGSGMDTRSEADTADTSSSEPDTSVGCPGESDRRAGEACTNDCQCRSGICADGGCVHRFFRTSTTYSGYLGGLSGADAKCNAQASRAQLTGTWKAILSDTSTSAKSRIRVAAGLYNMSPDRDVATDREDLWDGSIATRITRNAKGNNADVEYVWTGTEEDGSSAAKNCDNWTNASTSSGGHVGGTDVGVPAYWISITASNECKASNIIGLYCIDGQ